MLLLLAGCGSEHVGSARAADVSGGLYPDVVETMGQFGIQNQQQQDLLRFTTAHWNQGNGPLQIRRAGDDSVVPCPPGSEPGATTCIPLTQEVLDANGNVVYTQPAGFGLVDVQHSLWHQPLIVRYQLHQDTLDGAVVLEATKVSDCMVDTASDPSFVHENSTKTYNDCNVDLQGISVGWSDEYHQSAPGQTLDVTDLAEGTYYLTDEVNYKGYWAETRTDNDVTWAGLALTRTGANPEVTVIAQRPCPSHDDPYPYQVLCGTSANE